MLKRLSHHPLRLILLYAIVGIAGVLLMEGLEVFLKDSAAGKGFADIVVGVLYVSGGALLAYFMVVSDQERISESEQLSGQRAEAFKAAIEAAPVGVIALNREGRVQYWSRNATEIFGLSAVEMKDKLLPLTAPRPEPWGTATLSGPDRQDTPPGPGTSLDWVAQGMAGELKAGFEVAHTRPDGLVVQLHIRVAPIFASAGLSGVTGAGAGVNGLMVVAADITRQRQDAVAARATQSRLLILSEIGRILANGDLEPADRLEKAARMLVPALADWCLLDLTDQDGAPRRAAVLHADQRLAGTAAALRQADLTQGWYQERTAELVSHPEGILRQMVGGQGGGLVPSGDPLLEQMASLGVTCNSAILMPICARGQAYGAITLFSAQDGRMLTMADLALLRDVATRMGFVLADERLLREAQASAQGLGQRMAELRGLAGAAVALNSSLAPDKVLQVISDQAMALIGAQVAGAALASPDGGGLEMVAYSYTGKHAGFATYQSAAAPNGAGIHEWVMKRKTPVRLTQAELLAHPAFERFGAEAGKHPAIRGLLCVPLVGRTGETLGFVQVSDRKSGDFTEQDERLLVHLAQFAAVAVENARLHFGVAQAEKLLQHQSEMLRSITDNMAQGLLGLDATGRITFANQVAEQLLDRRESDLRGRCLHDLIHCPEPVPECSAGDCMALQVLKTGAEQLFRETLFARRDGSFIPVAYTAAPLWQKGQTRGAVITFAPVAAQGFVRGWRVAEDLTKK